MVVFIAYNPFVYIKDSLEFKNLYPPLFSTDFLKLKTIFSLDATKLILAALFRRIMDKRKILQFSLWIIIGIPSI